MVLAYDAPTNSIFDQCANRMYYMFMSELGFSTEILPLEYRGEKGVVPIVLDSFDMVVMIESRLKPGLESLMSEVPPELVEYAGYALSTYTLPENTFRNKYPDVAESLAGSLILQGLGVDRMGSSYTQDVWVTDLECLDWLGSKPYDLIDAQHISVWSQQAMAEQAGFVIGPVVRTNTINGWHTPSPTDQYPTINYRTQHAVMVPGTILLNWLKAKYPTLEEGYAITKPMMAELFIDDFGMTPEDNTYGDWYHGFMLHGLNKVGKVPYYQDPASWVNNS